MFWGFTNTYSQGIWKTRVKGKDRLPNQHSYSFRGSFFFHPCLETWEMHQSLEKLFKLGFIKVENAHNLYSSDLGSGIRCARIRFMISWGWSLKVKGNMMASLSDKLEDDEIFQADISIDVRCEGIDSYSEMCCSNRLNTHNLSTSSTNHCLKK